eukprot:gene5426-10880_t
MTSGKHKINLYNTRFKVDQGSSSGRIFDSLEETYSPPTILSPGGKISTLIERFQDCGRKTDAFLPLNPVQFTNLGDPIEIQKRMQCPNRVLRLECGSKTIIRHSWSGVEDKFGTAKSTCSVDTLNRMADRIHDTKLDTIEGAVRSNLISGGHWGNRTSSRDMHKRPTTSVGPGDYDITKWEKSEVGHWRRPLSTRFSISDRDSSGGGGGSPLPLDTPSPTTYFNDVSFKPTGSVPNFKVDKVQRFRTHHQPKHLRHTGLLLSHDFDRKLCEPDIPLSLARREVARPSPKVEVYPVPHLNPNALHKMSLQKCVEKSSRKYA